ncbi:MAG: T9SS type A sorting domain-containing protein [Candidatus Edwardsbacteria bacterium]|nr:T9SS type A sorting domain-containing protein [Candidatus Edwardsbacteria bacterium]MBU1576937.1 T9SS type A sorting domain-containing protein [Candidatus Edwardsbacteria bacterium]MBU2463303.1 T9SS type A sorting domain-containing protein [Candidatus Edwardsbacteria bacterium]MBU2593748.1 T9SS type A sorting domain-containing protein [Candidatus Edwardsbacteria bacterium]
MKKVLSMVVLLTSFQLIAHADSLNVRTVGVYDTPGFAKKVFVNNDHAFIADDAWGLRIINIANPAMPYEVGYCDSVFACDVFVLDSFAYIASGTSGLTIINISDYNNPHFAGCYNTPGYAKRLTVSGNYAYVADYNCGLRIINISDPAFPFEVGYYDTPGNTCGVAVMDSFAYLADGDSGLRKVNISDKANPFLTNWAWTSIANDYALSLAISGDFVYVAWGHFGLHAFRKDSLIAIGMFSTYNSRDVALNGKYAFIADGEYGLKVFDISTYQTIGYYNTPDLCYGVTYSDSLIFVADGLSGLRILQGYGPAGVADEQRSPAEIKTTGLTLEVLGNKISYQLPQNGNASLKIYNLLGQEVRALFSENKRSGVYNISWDGNNEAGHKVASGVYLVGLHSQGQRASGKIVVVR